MSVADAFLAKVRAELGPVAELVLGGERVKVVVEVEGYGMVLVHCRGLDEDKPFAIYSDGEGWKAFATRAQLLAILG
jgi:hypothetical protein